MTTDRADGAQGTPFVRSFQGSVTLIEFDGRPVVAARELGVALGYSENGGRLVDLVGGEWADEFLPDVDFILLRNGRLAEFKRIVGELGLGRLVDKRAPSLLLLTESGIQLVLARSEKQAGKDFRRWLVSEVIPEYHRAKALPGPAPELDGAGASLPAPRPRRAPGSAPGRRRRHEPPAAVRLLRALLRRMEARMEPAAYAALDVALHEVEGLPDPLQGLDALDPELEAGDEELDATKRKALLMNLAASIAVLHTSDISRLLRWAHSRPMIPSAGPRAVPGPGSRRSS
jgi:prophage antirepressor-like protein